MFAIADTLDALTTERPYRSAGSIPDARAVIREQAAAQFDPRIVDAFDDIPDSDIERIRAEIG